ncbi:MAG: F0F1 ATP synthase subunit A [Deltaproteobacteria bacterium]|nr:F0F1 ATP synthase subunit A [Deltaproteobacteria bacterium]MBI4796959.1 F0F1 ATP synthase subunit A [Deltaproteobacteria bacterium]
MELSLDQWVLWRWGPVVLNATILYTWLVMALLVLGSWLVTRRLSTGAKISPWQNLLEVLVAGMREQIRQISQQDPGPFLPFIGTLFVFISFSNLLTVLPGYHPPTYSLSTTAGLAICVLAAVPFYGIAQQGVRGYLSHYLKPTILMLPFHILSELTRTLALAVRLFGNVMSGALLGAILLAVVPLFFPLVMQLLELLIGQVQAFIFAVLATVYIASAAQAHEEKREALRQRPAEENQGPDKSKEDTNT